MGKLKNWLAYSKNGISRWALIGWGVIIIAMLLLLLSCSPVKRLSRLQKHHPYLFENIKDTVVVLDTIQVNIPGTTVDTLVHRSALKDTVYIEKENLSARVYEVGDTVYIEAKTDTIVKYVPYEKEVIVDRFVPHKPRDKLSWLIWLLPLILFLTFLWCFYIVIKYQKKQHR